MAKTRSVVISMRLPAESGNRLKRTAIRHGWTTGDASAARRRRRSSARKFGGNVEDYLSVHRWFDESKGLFPDFRHRALRHHAEGIFLAERIFGITVLNRDKIEVPVRYLGEQHVREDLGRIPTDQDWLERIHPSV